MKYFRNKKILYSAIAVLIIAIIFTARLGGGSSDARSGTDRVRTIDIVSLADASGGMRIVTTGPVVSSNEADLKSQASGQITFSNVKIGDRVSAGQVIARLTNSDIVAQLAQAQAAVEIQQAQLAELERNSSRGSDLASLQDQQDTLIKNAYKNLLNNDLRAYPMGDAYEVDVPAPIITGSYNSLEEGTYIIETYGSAAPSGFSFRLSGLETDVGTGSLSFAVPLGSRGLYISFVDGQDVYHRNKKWIVEIPNKRSSSYVSAQNAYQAAIRGKDVALEQSTVSDQRINAQKAQVRQAQANVQTVQAQLAKTSIRAPFAGSVTSVSANVGEFVSIGQSIVTLINSSGLHVQTFVSSEESKLITVGDSATINGTIPAVVTNVSAGINTTNGKVEVLVSPTQSGNAIIVGEYVDVSILSSAGGGVSGTVPTVPLRAVKPQADGSIVYVVNEENILEELEVTTGAIIGDFIEITTPLDPSLKIAASARGLTAGMKVELRKN